MPRDEITLRMSDPNVERLVRGVECDVTFIRLAKGVDGVYELYLEGRGAPPLVDWGSQPAVPIV